MLTAQELTPVSALHPLDGASVLIAGATGGLGRAIGAEANQNLGRPSTT